MSEIQPHYPYTDSDRFTEDASEKCSDEQWEAFCEGGSPDRRFVEEEPVTRKDWRSIEEMLEEAVEVGPGDPRLMGR